MSTKKVKAAAILIMPLCLCACQSFPLFGLGKGRNIDQASNHFEVNSADNSLTELGRKELRQNRVAAAIGAFQTALASGENPAPAFNGLGVAYSKLDRLDVAQRYFSKAALLDPSDQKIARNLLRVTHQFELAHSAQEDMTAFENVASSDSESSFEKSASADQQAPGRIRRIDARTVEVRSAAVERGNKLAVVDSRFKPVVRIPLEEANREKASEPDYRSRGKAVETDPNFKPLVRVALREPALTNSGRKIVEF